MTLIKKQKGFSLLELLLVVAVGAILLLAGLAIYRNVTNNANVNEATRLLNVIKQETQRLYQGEGEYGTDELNDTLITADVIPSSALSGTTIRHPYNDDVTVDGATNTFTVQFDNIPTSACISLGQSYNEDDPDFVSLNIAGDDIADNTVAELDDACTDSDEVNMIWTFF